MVGAAPGALAAGRGLTVGAARGDEERTELGRSFLALREAADLSQPAVAQAVEKLTQTQLSRIEWGASLPTEAQADALGKLYGLGPEARAELVQRVKDARAGIRDTRLVIQRGKTLALQQRWRRREERSRLVRAYQPAVVLGVAQTVAYASAAMRLPEHSDEVRDRMLRHVRLLDGPTPRQVLVHTEGALRFTVGSPAVMAEQIDALIAASHRPHVDIRVIPADRPVRRVTTNAFHIYDSREVVVGLEVAAASLDAPADIAHFEQLFADLEASAVSGDEARDLLGRIAADHR